MKPGKSYVKQLLAVVVAGMLVTSPVFAKKSEDGEGHGKKHQGHGQSKSHRGNDQGESDPRGHSNTYVHSDGPDVKVNVFFGDGQRTVVRDYYRDDFKGGHCPPGLAKKHNGCMPPGQAKKWRKGHPLPSDVIYYDLPSRLVVELGAPPAGHKFVRVAADILLIAVGTGMVIDAIEDLGSL